MRIIVFLGLLFVAMLLLFGKVCKDIIFDKLEYNLRTASLIILSILGIAITGALFLKSIDNCYQSSKEKMEFSLDEYNMSEKPAIIEKGDTVKIEIIFSSRKK